VSFIVYLYIVFPFNYSLDSFNFGCFFLFLYFVLPRYGDVEFIKNTVAIVRRTIDHTQPRESRASNTVTFQRQRVIDDWLAARPPTHITFAMQFYSTFDSASQCSDDANVETCRISLSFDKAKTRRKRREFFATISSFYSSWQRHCNALGCRVSQWLEPCRCHQPLKTSFTNEFDDRCSTTDFTNSCWRPNTNKWNVDDLLVDALLLSSAAPLAH